MLARAAEFARVIGNAGIQHDAVADLDRFYIRPDGFDDSGAIGADHPGESIRRARQPFCDKQIEMIERGGVNPDAHLARFGGRCVRDVGDLELVDSAGGGENAGAQGGAPEIYGLNVGVIICSVPVVGMGIGVAELTGWM